uniref:protein LAZY 1-like n=1 Tax=Erigeron canadensis TaxID=72917 RepID=UPI001CB92391|nr:protein LAZY 1-like [Erigeron canadensis]
MKLLDWMQHKFRQTNNEPLTEFPPRNICSYLTRQPSFDDLQYYPKSHSYAKAPSNTQREKQFRKSFACIETARVDNQQAEEESTAAFSEIFHGFLAIGTLATENVTIEPVTPTFGTSIENNMGRQNEATENELKFINDGLEEVLEPEEEDDGAENDTNEKIVCRLQDYLFDSVIGMPETETETKKRRTSLEELFRRTKVAEEMAEAKSNKLEKKKDKETEKSAFNLMKKILKGKTFHLSSSRSTADKKPRKILQLFHKKIHPEGRPDVLKSEDHYKHVTNEEYNKNQSLSEDIILFPKMDTYKKGPNCIKSSMAHFACCMSDSDGNKECWIKSDSEYLVLEL